jgi:hypothetical protein
MSETNKGYLERPFTRREIFREGLGFVMVAAGGSTALGVAAETEDSSRDDSKLLALGAVGVGALLVGLNEMAKVNDLVHNITFEEFVDYLKDEQVTHVSVSAQRDEVIEGVAIGANGAIFNQKVGEGYFTVYQATSSKGKEILFKQRNDLIKSDPSSPVHKIAEMKNALTAYKRALLLEDNLPGIVAVVPQDKRTEDLTDEALRTGLKAYPMVKAK